MTERKNNDDLAAGTAGCLGLIAGGFVVVWFVALMINIFSFDSNKLEKQVAKEYRIPISEVQRILLFKVTWDTKYFPIPHSVWYVTTERGEEIEIASDYFGGDIDIDKDALNRCFGLDQYTEVFRDYPGW